MSHNASRKNNLERRFGALVQKHVDTDQRVSALDALYEHNASTVDGVLTTDLARFDEALKTLEKDHTNTIKNLDREHEKRSKSLMRARDSADSELDQTTHELVEALEKKQTLNDLKAQKIDDEYRIALSHIDRRERERQQTLDKRVENETKTFYDRTVELEKTTAIAVDNLDQRIKEKTLAITERLDKHNDETEHALAEIDQRVQTVLRNTRRDVKDLKAAYVEAKKPKDADIESQKEAQSNARTEAEKEHDEAINKNIRYRNEKEKLDDKDGVARYNKTIKQLRKTKEDALDQLDKTHQEAQKPLEKDRDDLVKAYEERFFNLKKQAVETLRNLLIERAQTHAEALMTANAINIERLKVEAEHEHRKETTHIDHDIQLINFNQTLEEARLNYEKETARLKPESGIESTEAKRRFNREKNALSVKRDIEKAQHEATKEKARLEHQRVLKELERQRAEADVTLAHEKTMARHRRRLALYAKDLDKEKHHINRYYRHAKNYTALKNDHVRAHGPSTHLAVTAHLETQRETYRAMLDKAEHDHKRIITRIEETYRNEIAIYDAALKKLDHDHEEELRTLVSAQAKERNKDLEAIEALDGKKDRIRIRKLKRDLAQKQTNHDEAVAIKKRELEQRRSLYTSMREAINAFKLQSIEEAETLLMHVRDQIHGAMRDLEKAAEKEKALFEHVHYEIKHSADLFNTFQLQRREDTLDKATRYHDRRVAVENEKIDALMRETETRRARIESETEAAIQKIDRAIERVLSDTEAQVSSLRGREKDNASQIDRSAGEDTRKLKAKLDRIDEKHDKRQNELSDTKKKEKDACFKRKTKAEEDLEAMLALREDENEQYEKERRKMLDEDVERITNHAESIIEKLQKDPIRLPREKDLGKLLDALQGEATIDTLFA